MSALFSDTLWIYTSIVGALLGAAFLTYFKSTRAGVWSYSKFDQIIDFLRDRYQWTWLDQPQDAWKKTYPNISSKLDELEKRISNLEEKIHD